jgi:hypothetical protein
MGVNPDDGTRLLILSGKLAPQSGNRRVSGASREQQWKWVDARTGGHDENQAATWLGAVIDACQAWSPSSRNAW